MGTLTDERWFAARPDRVFAALTKALHSLRWNIRSTDEDAHSVAFSTPMAGFSWGANMSASVTASAEGGLVRVSGAAKVWGNVLAGGAERQNITRLLDAAGAQLQAMLEQDPSEAAQRRQGATQHGGSLADELAKLAALRDAGALSPAEFDTAKSRLLG